MTDLIDIPVNQIAEYQQAALMRLQVYVTGRVHEIFIDYLDRLIGKFGPYTRDDGTLDPLSIFALRRAAEQEWRPTITAYEDLLTEARYQAAAIPFGSLARHHQYFMSLLDESTEGYRPGILPFLRRLFSEAGEFPVAFETQLGELLQATSDRVYSDKFKLSERVWRLDQNSLAGIQARLTAGISAQRQVRPKRGADEITVSGSSAVEIARTLETYLGLGQDCPRWTLSRLNQLTKSDIAAGDRRGLISGNPCETKGVAYNALRLARNEIQIIHHAATDSLLGRSPWVEGENIVLSPAHPKKDICDEVVADNPHEVGAIVLPLHVLCLCFKEALLMNDSLFTNRMRGWIDGSEPWPEMDEYQVFVGAGRAGILNPALLLDLSQPLLRWLDGPKEDLDQVMLAERLEAVVA